MPRNAFEHHRRSIRLRGHDYSQAGAYFVTICVANRECIFGEVMGGEMRSNRVGKTVLRRWNDLPNYYPPVRLGEFVLMPNHMHGIVIITYGSGVGAGTRIPPRNAAIGFGPSSGPGVGAAFRRPSDKRTLGQVLGYFKFQITKEINRINDTGYERALQRGYYEHIIRGEREWTAIAEYIRNNPSNWRIDTDNPANFPQRPPPKTSDEYWHDATL